MRNAKQGNDLKGPWDPQLQRDGFFGFSGFVYLLLIENIILLFSNERYQPRPGGNTINKASFS